MSALLQYTGTDGPFLYASARQPQQPCFGLDPFLTAMTGAAPKRKGTRFEREIVHACRAAGLEASRAWSSDGRTLRTADGAYCAGTIDVLVEGRLRVQAKRRARLAAYLRPPLGTHVSVIREDRGEAFAVVPWSLFVRMLRRCFEVPPRGSSD